MEVLIAAALLLIYSHLSGNDYAKSAGMGLLYGVATAGLLAIGVIAFLLLT